jgi:hypothetical protein
MSDHVLPAQTKPKLIVVVAFDRADDGELFTVYGRPISRARNARSALPRRSLQIMSASSPGAVTRIRRSATTERQRCCSPAAMFLTWSRA